MKNNKAEIVKIIKFCFIGMLNTAIDWGVSSICFVLLSLAETVSNGIGYTIGGLFSYTVNRKWTFKTKGKFFSTEMLKFFLSGAIMLLINIGLTKLFVDVIFIDTNLSEAWVYYISKAIITVTVVALNYISSRFLVFRTKDTQSK